MEGARRATGVSPSLVARKGVYHECERRRKITNQSIPQGKEEKAVLIPREYTKLDEIVNVVFSTGEDIEEEQLTDQDETEDKDRREKKFIPVSFHENCVLRVEKFVGIDLLKRTRSKYSSFDDSVALVCNVSKEHTRYEHRRFWFAFHPHQRDFIVDRERGYVAFGCGSEENILLIPAVDFIPLLDNMNITEKEDRYYWHVHISTDEDEYIMHLKGGMDPIIVSKYLLK